MRVLLPLIVWLSCGAAMGREPASGAGASAAQDKGRAKIEDTGAVQGGAQDRDQDQGKASAAGGVAGAREDAPQVGVAGRVVYRGKPVPGAVVTVRQQGRQWQTVTDEQGRFAVAEVGEGPVEVEARLFGFELARRTVAGAERARVEIAMTIPAPGAGQTAGESILSGTAAGGTWEGQVSAALEPAAPVSADPGEASESFLVQGSLSRGLQEAGRPGFFEFGFGAPMMAGMLGPGGAPGGPIGAEGGGAAGGAGGLGGAPGGFGGGPGGGMGMPGGGMGGRGGGMMMGGGPGGGPGMRGGMGQGGLGRLLEEFRNLSPEEQEKMKRALAERFGGALQREGFGNRAQRGRQQIRGGLFFTLRNDALDAAPYGVNGRPVEKPQYTQPRFGGTLGGPLKLGRLFGADNTFFFLNYNASRGNTVYNGFAVLPDAAVRAGDFRQPEPLKPTVIYDPLSGAPFPDNRLPEARISPIAQGLLRFIPLPNRPGAVQNWTLSAAQPQSTDNLNLRLNRTLNRRNRLALDLAWQRRYSENIQLFGWRDPSRGRGWNTSVAWSQTLTPRLIHSISARYNRNYNALIPYFAYGEDVAGQLGIAGASRDPANFGPPNLNFTNYGDLSDGNRSRRMVHTWNFSDGWTVVRRVHTVRVGFEFTRTQQNTLTDPNARGTLFFGGLLTSGLDAAGRPLPGTGNDFADFLLGYVQQSSVRFGQPDTYMRQSVFSVFAQDEWRARPGLTLNAGVRYDTWLPFTEKYGRMANLDLAPGWTGAAVVTPGGQGPWLGPVPDGLIRADHNNVAPRLGLAWRPSQKRRTILRLGYSVFYDASVFGRIAQRLVYQPPFATAATFNTSPAARLTLAAPFRGPETQTILNSYAVNPDYRAPYAQTWNASVQQDVRGYVVELSYLGTKGTALVIQRIPNRAPPGSPVDSELRRPIPYATGFTYDSPEGSSIFHAGQVRVVKRMRRGVSWTALYTFSKSIDNASSIGGTGNIVVQDENNLRAERGLSNFDMRHQFQFSGMFTSPFGPAGIWMRQRNAWTRLLQNWNLNLNLQANSGRPLTARVLGSVADPGGSGATGSARADATGLPVKSGTGYFNTAAFAVPPADRYGNAGRNTIPGPGSVVLNAGFGRSFQLGESAMRRLELRLEGQNILNHVNLTSYGTVVNAANYGQATAAGPMRSLQITARFRF